jgi:hypothetical protein
LHVLLQDEAQDLVSLLLMGMEDKEVEKWAFQTQPTAD